MKNLEMIWPKFAHSTEIDELDDYSRTEIKGILEEFFKFMKNIGFENPKMWNDENIFGFLDIFATYTEEEFKNDQSVVDEFLPTYDIISVFLKYAAKYNLISLTYQEMQILLSDFKRQVAFLNGGKEENSLIDSYSKDIDQSSLPQWRSYTANDIAMYTNSWVKSYMNSPAWKHRTKGVTKLIVTTSMSTLTEKAYDVYRKTPKSWTKKAIHGILTTYFISNIDFSMKQYKYVVPALSELLEFVASKGLINTNRVKNYKRYLQASEAEMLDLANNPQNFGPAKTAMINMNQQGIDINDSEAVQKYMDQVNADNGLYDIDPDSQSRINLNNYESLTTEQMSKAIVENDYDPDQYYLEARHVTNNGKNFWNENEAKRIHNLGTEYGIELWLKREKYGLVGKVTLSDTVMTVSYVLDTMYAQALELPDQWEVLVWQHFVSWLREVHSNNQYKIFSFIVKALVTMFFDEKIISAEICEGIFQIFQAKVISMNDVQLVNGKLRKKKKSKKRK